MKILCAFGRHAYGDPNRGEGYEFTNFIPALRALGHDTVVFDTWDRSKYRDFPDLNRAFLKTVQTEKPDIIFCVLMGYELWQETLRLARDTGCVLVNWATDDSWKYREFSRFVAPSFDVFATTYRSAIRNAWHDGYQNFVMTQWAASGSQLAVPKPWDQCRYRVSFIGTAYGDRRRWIQALTEAGIDVACFGHGWPGGAIASERIPVIVRDSAVSLNFSGSSKMHAQGANGARSQIKARIFEVTGMGGCLLTEMAEGLEDYFRLGVEVETFSTSEELVLKVRRLLSDPVHRDAVAHAGNIRTSTEHTYESRFRELLAVAARLAGQRKIDPARLDWSEFERAVARHRTGRVAVGMAVGLRKLCSIFWGPARGARAARRATYELSWRLARGQTYSAAGWPGRLFYRES